MAANGQGNGIRFLLAGLLACGVSGPGLADEPLVPAAETFTTAGLQLRWEAGLRWQQGAAREIVYNGSLLLSDLTWDIENLLLAGGGLQLTFLEQWELSLHYWQAVTEGTGEMTDYDYFLPGIWTDFSDGNVEINQARLLELEAAWGYRLPFALRLRLLGGYRHWQWDWSQYGGAFIYSVNGFRDFRGTFPAEQNGINYKQTFEIPYAGLGLGGRWQSWVWDTYWHFSPVARAKGSDEHVLRQVLFEDRFREVTYYAAGISLAYQFADTWRIGCAWDWHTIPETRGKMTIINQADGTTETLADTAGIANQAWNLSFSSSMVF